MLDRVTGMQVFQRVASLGSFSAAARALGMSPAMATKHVVAIEERLGARLFHRTTRKLTLTEAGARYRDACERILAEIDEAEAAAAADVIEPRGVLRVNAPLAFGMREIMPAVADYLAAHPAVTVDLGLTDRFVDLVDEGWDLAIRIGALRDSTLVQRKLAPVRTVVAASPAYLARRGTPRTIADLAGHACLGYTLPTAASAERWVLGPGSDDAIPVSGPLRVNNGDALRLAAIAGLGIINQPTFIIGEDLRAGRLVALGLDRASFVFGNAFAVYPPNRTLPTKARRFIDLLASRWGDVPPWDRGLAI